MKISSRSWKSYIDRLSKIDKKAADTVANFYRENPDISVEQLIGYCLSVADYYGNAAGELACEMYEEVAIASGKVIPTPEPARTATYREVATALNGTLLRTQDPDAVGAVVGTKVKTVGLDTLLNNSLRDGAQFAWIPSGDTCAFCIMLASNGWQRASKKALKNGHASHVHNNCNCTYAIRFDDDTEVEGYDPEYYKDLYDNSEGDNWKDKVNSMRRDHYAANKDKINEQKRIAYMKRKMLENDEGNDIINTVKISSPIESRKHPTGNPPGIAIAGDRISGRQAKILSKLPEYDSRYVFKKNEVSMKDLAALTAHTNAEFAMFTKGGDRLIIRGERNSVNVKRNAAKALAKEGYKWSGHTHPGMNYYDIVPSPGDRDILEAMGQKYSVIYSSTGRKYVFAVSSEDDIGRKD